MQMKHKILDQVLERADSAKDDADFTYFHSLLIAGEALVKTITLGMIAAIVDDKDRNRYRLEHCLVKADGLGDWGRMLEDALTGQASQYLLPDAHREQRELNESHHIGVWQYEAVSTLKSALDDMEIESEDLPVKSDMKRWFRLFTTLRNKTRGHGAINPSTVNKPAKYIARSIHYIYENFSLFDRPWVFLHRNLSGKYRVSPIAGDSSPFDFLRKEPTHSHVNGVYIYFDIPRRVPLINSTAELHDFSFANGGFNGRKYDLLSYYTGDTPHGDASEYSTPPGSLRASETEGYGELREVGKCFSNVPDVTRDYVDRPRLEEQLYDLLVDDRNRIITLVGKGGIGKTSLSLKVIEKLCADEHERYFAIIWLSARDVDLLRDGPKPVHQSVSTSEEMSELYVNLVLSEEKIKDKGLDSKAYFQEQLEKNELGSVLYVFDNFETTQNPVEMFNWIETYIRLPNKVLITTRLRDFKADYPVEVLGMEEQEAIELVEQTASNLGISQLLNKKYITDLISRSEGHPYVMKVLLGEVAKSGKVENIRNIVAGRDEILTALFERTYSALSPCGQRAFMTLAAWNSAVPRVALEAVLMRSIPERDEVEKGIESLIQFSMAENYKAQDNQEFISLPLVASIFGKKKLKISPASVSIKLDVEILQMLGPSKSDDIRLGLAKRLERFIGNISRRIDSGESFDNYAEILDMICRNYNPGWLILARWHLENHTTDDIKRAKEELESFLQEEPRENVPEAWEMLADACKRTGDFLGEVHALIERAKISTVSFHDVSNTANRLNWLLKERELDIGKEEKRLLVQGLADVLEKRKNEAEANANADDYSRMAWLNLHLDREQIAKEYAEKGLEIEPGNQHCEKILERLQSGT